MSFMTLLQNCIASDLTCVDTGPTSECLRCCSYLESLWKCHILTTTQTVWSRVTRQWVMSPTIDSWIQGWQVGLDALMLPKKMVNYVRVCGLCRFRVR